MCPKSLDLDHGRRDGGNSNDGRPVPSTSTTTTHRVKVAIVGAGASGLQCCNTLIKDYGLDASDIVLLEARNRIGGRIHRTIEHATNVVDGTSCHFSMDHGAAWVHGTGLKWGSIAAPLLDNADSHQNDDDDDRPVANPMMNLLFEETSMAAVTDAVENDTTSSATYDRHLNPVFIGNPWMRPRHVLHNQGQLSLFVAGRQLDYKNSNDDSSSDDRRIIQQALQRHFTAMRDAHRAGLNLFHERRGMETATTSLGETIDSIVANNDFYREQLQKLPPDEAALVQALAPFYLLLVECWYGCAVADLQLCEFTEETETIPNAEDAEYRCEGDFAGPHCTLKRGMTSVLQPLLSNGVRNRVLLEQQVTKIACHAHAADDGTISNDDGDNCIVIDTAAGLKVHADACVVTIPAGCVKEAINGNVFATALSDEKLQAISYLKMGSYKKVFLTFDRIFWPAQPAFMGLVRSLNVNKSDKSHSHPLGNHVLFDNLWAARGIPSIEAVLFGDAGAWSIHKNDHDIQHAILDFMADAMGLDVLQLQRYCQTCHVTRWEEDKYSRGAYSSLALGALESHVEELRRPEWNGRLVFAGEATISEFEGSVYAALLSGVTAAKNINACLLASVDTDIANAATTNNEK